MDDAHDALKAARRGGNSADIAAAAHVFDATVVEFDTAKAVWETADVALQVARIGSEAASRLLDGQKTKLVLLNADAKTAEANHREAYKNVLTLTQELNTLEKS
jgi:hypothetical protein